MGDLRWWVTSVKPSAFYGVPRCGYLAPSSSAAADRITCMSKDSSIPSVCTRKAMFDHNLNICLNSLSARFTV